MALLAEDFREFGSSGRVFNRKEIIQELSTEEGVSVTIDDFEVTMIAADVALATYTANRHAGTTRRSRRSSLWVLREGRWQMLFHQGTRLPE
jgi:hypothetical protein